MIATHGKDFVTLEKRKVDLLPNVQKIDYNMNGRMSPTHSILMNFGRYVRLLIAL